MSLRWKDSETTKFIEQYKSSRCLWDSNLSTYKNRGARESAYRKILEEIDIPGTTVLDIKNKIKNLRSTFHQEVKKIKASQKNGECYIPRLCWFNDFKEIMGVQPKIESRSNMVASPEVPEEDEASLTSSASSETCNTLNGNPSTSIRPTPRRQTVRCRVNPPALQVAEIQMKKSLSTLNNVLNKKRTEEDECDLYAKLLAKKLRRLPEHERELLMYEIDGLYINRARNHSDPLENIPSLYIENRPTSAHSSYSEKL